MRGSKQAPGVHEPKDMKMWGCKDIDKHPEYMNLRIRGVRMRGYQQAPRVHELRIWGCEDARIQVNTYKHKNIRMQGYKQVQDIKYADYF